MLVKEFRVILPLTVQEYNIGQLWSVAEASKSETGGGEGIEVSVNEPFTEEKYPPTPALPVIEGKGFPTGQYTRKKYYLASKVPALVRYVAPKGSLELEENAWNAFPYCRTILENPSYMGDKFFIRVETMHYQDAGEHENIHQLPPDILEKREVIYIDIANDELYTKSDYNDASDPAKFQSEKTGRGPLVGREWWKNTEMPVMCAYKLVYCDFVWWGLQDRIENMIMTMERRVFTNFHRRMFCWMDQWHGLSMQDIRDLEKKTKEELAVKRAQGELCGTVDTS